MGGAAGAGAGAGSDVSSVGGSDRSTACRAAAEFGGSLVDDVAEERMRLASAKSPYTSSVCIRNLLRSPLFLLLASPRCCLVASEYSESPFFFLRHKSFALCRGGGAAAATVQRELHRLLAQSRKRWWRQPRPRHRLPPAAPPPLRARPPAGSTPESPRGA